MWCRWRHKPKVSTSRMITLAIWDSQEVSDSYYSPRSSWCSCRSNNSSLRGFITAIRSWHYSALTVTLRKDVLLPKSGRCTTKSWVCTWTRSTKSIGRTCSSASELLYWSSSKFLSSGGSKLANWLRYRITSLSTTWRSMGRSSSMLREEPSRSSWNRQRCVTMRSDISSSSIQTRRV